MTRRLTLACLGLLGLGLSLAAPPAGSAAQEDPIRCLIITGDHRGHDWKETTRILEAFLEEGGRIVVDVTATPAKDLNPENLARYDVLLLNYRQGNEPPSGTVWTEENKRALLDAVEGGTGLVVYHFASSAFADPNWEEYERMIGGGWRTQGFHGPKHNFTVKKALVEHPISAGLPEQFAHEVDELYQNSKMVEGNVVLATAYSDPNLPRGTGKDEPVIWVNSYGSGRVYNNALGHDATAISDPLFQEWMRRGVEWAATGEVAASGGK
ncbi:ThuA domain-containing protein [Tautonia sociabilis]|uniref:ThuA domain-containing protein n=1 Tax=Tautonia sociabilis TaxID=2080755 RepID=A0A432MIP9_9BACT|nr:ThuA domain-containing protein [Tautonia sociabilis]RUL87244.1 ThuA domain-containing protein [Tautonia sociabilis]